MSDVRCDLSFRGSRFVLLTVLVVGLSAVVPAPAAVDISGLGRGHRLLLEHGLQLQAVWFLPYNTLNRNRWAESNFTTMHFGSTDWTSVLRGSAYTNWARWATPSNPASITYDTDRWIMATEVDELNLFEPSNISRYASWLTKMRRHLPQVISYTTQSGQGAGSLETLNQYTQQAKPDLLFFDDYVFEYQHWGPWPGGSPTRMYSNMAKYHWAGKRGTEGDFSQPIPVGNWIQTFKADDLADNEHIVSKSEIGLQYFSAWAFGYKAIAAFTYTTYDQTDEVASVFFDGRFDTRPTDLFYHAAEMNRQSLNLGPALIRLLNTDIRINLGQNGMGENDRPEFMLRWKPKAGETEYMTNITATNLGAKNNGRPGDVLVGYFKAMLEEFDGPDYEGEEYFMIVNGLSDPNGTEVETAQLIRLDFDFRDSGITSLQRLSRDTGEVVDVPLVFDGGSRYHIDLGLLGGEGDLFKFNTGAPFITDVPISQSDFDLDGDTDGDDFIIWQNNFPTASGAIGFQGDGNFDGAITGDDFLIWQNQFPSSGALAMAPEPISVVMLFGLSGLLVMRRPRKRP